MVNSLDIQLAERQDFNKASKKIIAACLALNLYEEKKLFHYYVSIDLDPFNCFHSPMESQIYISYKYIR